MEEEMNRLRVAIGEQLKACPQVRTLGVRSQMADYTEPERGLLRDADIIFYPTGRFVDLFATLGKETFPSVNCYRLRGDRLKQVALLRMLDAPYPRTRVYYGHKQKQDILKDFAFPLIAKKPFGSAAGRDVFFVDNREKLEWYKQNFNPAYIQEHVPAEQELRVVVVNYSNVLAYRGKTTGGNLQEKRVEGVKLEKNNLPSEAVGLAKKIALNGDLSDVAVEMIFDGSQFWVIELDFQCEETGGLQIGKERLKMIMEMIERGEL